MPQPNINIASLTPCSHGGLDYAEMQEQGLDPNNMIDFSTNCNPSGPPPGLNKIIESAKISQYPDSQSLKLRNVLADKLGVSPLNIIVGHGSTEIIRLIAAAYLNSTCSALIPKPCYSDYETACILSNCSVISEPRVIIEPFHQDIAPIMESISLYKPKAIFLCNPNNPTGQYFNQTSILKLITSCPQTLVILDEAYIAFTDNPLVSLPLIEHDNVIVVRSMTKDYALAGLRLGYAVATEEIISALDRVKPPWNVSSVAQEAGIFVLQADSYLKECKDISNEAKNYLVNQLNTIGLIPVPSQTNFFLLNVGNATLFRTRLLKRGLLVRDCTSFGLPQYVRISAKLLPDCKKLVEALRETMEEYSAG